MKPGPTKHARLSASRPQSHRDKTQRSSCRAAGWRSRKMVRTRLAGQSVTLTPLVGRATLIVLSCGICSGRVWRRLLGVWRLDREGPAYWPALPGFRVVSGIATKAVRLLYKDHFWPFCCLGTARNGRSESKVSLLRHRLSCTGLTVRSRALFPLESCFVPTRFSYVPTCSLTCPPCTPRPPVLSPYSP